MDKNDIANILYKTVNLYLDFKEDGINHYKGEAKFYFDEKKNHDFEVKTLNLESKTITNEKDIASEDRDDVDKIKHAKKEIIELAQNIIKCKACPLFEGVKKVPGVGKVFSKLFVLSSVTSKEEEQFGFPMVGDVGDFFKKWLASIDISFEDVFITNVLKCPHSNKKITKSMIESCWAYFDKQLDIVRPKVVLTLGQLAVSSIKKSSYDLNTNHGKIFYYKQFKVLPTFHPSEVLANSSLKRAVWEDLKKLKAILEE